MTLQEALFKGYTQFCFRNKVYELNEENFNKYWDLHRKDDERDALFLVDSCSYSMKITPEEIIYNATEELFEDCYLKVISSKPFEIWKQATEKFVKESEELTTTYNVTSIQLIK